MIGHRGSAFSARIAPSPVRMVVTFGLVLACLLVGSGISVAHAAPAAPVVTGPTAIQFASHPRGFRATMSWQPVPTATSYRIYDADTLFYVGSVTGTSGVIYGMQGVLYRHYVIAVDSTGATSTPSNTMDIQTTAPVPPALPAAFALVPQTVFSVSSSSASSESLPIKIPFDPALVSGAAADLKMVHYDAGVWTDVTTSVDATKNIVAGAAPADSVFAVVEVTGSVTSTITPYAALHGSISPALPQVVAYGADSATFTVTADPGFHVSELVIDGLSVGALESYTFRNVTASHTISAYFAADPVTLATTTTLSGPSAVRARRVATFVGTVAPAVDVGTVAVRTYRLVRGAWSPVGSATVAVTGGSFSYQFVPTAKGSWQVRATYSGAVVGSTTYRPSVSAPLSFTVK